MDALEAIQRGARDFLLKLQAALLGKQRFPSSCMRIWSDFKVMEVVVSPLPPLVPT